MSNFLMLGQLGYGPYAEMCGNTSPDPPEPKRPRKGKKLQPQYRGGCSA